MINTVEPMGQQELDSIQASETAPGLKTARGNLPLKAMDVDAGITSLLAQTKVRQTFVNNHDDPIEATYIFPLPDRAAVTSFKMKAADRVIDGQIKERGEARRDYEEALRTGHRASLAEEDRPDVFTMQVGNIMPGEQVEVELELNGPLSINSNEATYRFPLVVAPRYIPGERILGPSAGDGVVEDTKAVPDASRITPPVLLPGHPNPVALSLKVSIDPAGLKFQNVRSSLHTVLHEQGEDGCCVLNVEPGERLNRDFILRFDLSDDEIQTSLRVSEDGDESTFLLTIVPPSITTAPRPRDVVIMLDRSSSMSGWKMVAARRAAGRMIDTLNDQDRFQVYAFDSQYEKPTGFEDDFIEATDRNRFQVIEYLSQVDARGGTELAGPLLAAVSTLTEAERDKVLVLATDGQVGNEDQILRSIEFQAKQIRIYTLGIDRAVNQGFLNRLASVGGGSFEQVESEDRLDEVMDSFHRRIGTPALHSLELVDEGLDLLEDTIVPRRLPDLFEGVPVSIMGRCKRAGTCRVAARTASNEQWGVSLDSILTETSLATSWTRGHIRELEDSHGAGRYELEPEIVRVSLEHSVLSRFTAYVAIDTREIVNEGGEVEKIIQPVEFPSGWESPAELREKRYANAGETARCCSMSIAPMAGKVGFAVDPGRYKARVESADVGRHLRKGSSFGFAGLDLEPTSSAGKKLAEVWKEILPIEEGDLREKLARLLDALDDFVRALDTQGIMPLPNILEVRVRMLREFVNRTEPIKIGQASAWLQNISLTLTGLLPGETDSQPTEPEKNWWAWLKSIPFTLCDFG